MPNVASACRAASRCHGCPGWPHQVGVLGRQLRSGWVRAMQASSTLWKESHQLWDRGCMKDSVVLYNGMGACCT